MRFGSWWAVQWALDRPFAVGVHLEPRTLTNSTQGVRFGPYVDVHLPFLILSVGRNPIYSGEVELLVGYSRGGVSADRI